MGTNQRLIDAARRALSFGRWRKAVERARDKAELERASAFLVRSGWELTSASILQSVTKD